MRVALILASLLLLLPVASARSITIHAGTAPDGSLYFDPKNVKAAKGDDVSLTLVNDDQDQPHDWALLSYDGRDIEAYTPPGASKTIQFKADAAGTFRIVCQVVGHKQRGMQGTFTVESKGLPGVGTPVALAALLGLAAARRRPAR